MKDGKPYRHSKAVCDCSNDKIIVEQHHKNDVNINTIVKRHAQGSDLIEKTAALRGDPQYQMDDIPTNDFQEAMNIVVKAQSTFDQLPSDIRKQFNNNPAEMLDFIQNPDNGPQLVEMGLAQRRPIDEPVQVVVTNQSTSETPATAAEEVAK